MERLTSLIGSAKSARVWPRPSHPSRFTGAGPWPQDAQRWLTIDFAPVVDVTDAPDDTVIGDRSFSDDPVKVTHYAGQYARGLRDAGVLPVLKHLPGHGRASGDSHKAGVVTPALDDLKNFDLGPYRTLSSARVGVMIGHMQVPGLTGGDLASLSPAAVSLLRNGSGYAGPALTARCSPTTCPP